MKYLIALALALTAITATASTKASSVTRHDITWTFDKEHTVGQFVNGDPWVLGPVNVIAITNSLSDEKFKPEGLDVSGSQVNPVIDSSGTHTAIRQGFDERLNQYDPELNAALPGGKPLSKDNPLALKPNDSLISTVSWLWLSREEKEPGMDHRPPADWKTGYAWPTLRTAAVLTVLAEAPPEGSFRPPYMGTDRTIKHNVKDLNLGILKKHAPVAAMLDAKPTEGARPNNYSPHPADMIATTSRVWMDHVPGWYGSVVHNPSLNLPAYGREVANLGLHALLGIHQDWDKIEGAANTDKKALAINLAQIGIDLAGMADNGTHWPADGGHSHGRYPLIIFAAQLLGDDHMKAVAARGARFQDLEGIYYVDDKHMDASSPVKNLNSWFGLHRRGGGVWSAIPYTEKLRGMPEWGCQPEVAMYSAGWNVAYREINNAAIPGLALGIMMTEGGRKAFNHEAYFDYADRVESSGRAIEKNNFNRPPAMAVQMWEAYRKDYPSTYDAKWDSQEILDHVTQPNFMMVPANNDKVGFQPDDPVRINLGSAVDLTALKKETLTVTLVVPKDEPTPDPLALAALEIETPKAADHFVMKFAPGALKPGQYEVKLDGEFYGNLRDHLGRPLTFPEVKFTVK